MDAAEELDLAGENAQLNGTTAEEVIAWADATFGEGLVMSTSFGATSAVMLHLVTRIIPDIPVICIDTGYLFPETYRFADELTRRLSLKVHYVAPAITAARQEAMFGNMWEQGEEGVQEYLRINKVEPMQRALADLGATAWMAGLRARQTEHRASLRRVERQNDRVKVHPILPWNDEAVEAYLAKHELPKHPLVAKGYRSIGDHHSTLPTTPDMDPRAGRILGKKQECGLHLPLTPGQNQSLKSSGL